VRINCQIGSKHSPSGGSAQKSWSLKDLRTAMTMPLQNVRGSDSILTSHKGEGHRNEGTVQCTVLFPRAEYRGKRENREYRISAYLKGAAPSKKGGLKNFLLDAIGSQGLPVRTEGRGSRCLLLDTKKSRALKVEKRKGVHKPTNS